MKKKILTTLSVVLVLGLAALGILAYLTSEDSDVNVMTLGNVEIDQIEHQRVDTAKGGILTEADIEDFEQGKPLLPYVDENINNAMRDDYEEVTFPSGQTSKLFIGDNAIDKMIAVTNKGKSDAYIRTIVALEAPTDKIDLSFNSSDWTMDTAASSYSIEVDGVKYDLFVCIYKKALKPGETTPYSLMQFSLDWTATNEDAAQYGDTYDILALSQAVQVEGFDNAKTALDTAFEAVTEETAQAWFSGEGFVVPEVAASYEDLKAVRGNDGNYVLSDDVNAENIIHFGNGTDVSLDLNGKTIEAENKNQFALGAQQGSKLHLTGEGTVNMGKGFMTNKGGAEITIDSGTYNMSATQTLNGMASNSVVQNDSKMVINGGTFTTNVDNAALFMATSNGRIEISGGFFENTADKTPDLLNIGTNKGNTNRIVITGGTFVNYNPLDDKMCYTGEWPAAGEAGFSGPWILIPGGYKVVSETQENGDIWYSVVPE